MNRAERGHPVKRRALVVDDDITGRLTLRGLLKGQGFDVLEAADGAEAVDSFIAHRPDIVFMDITMPVLDGLQAATRIKALAGDAFVPILFVTGASADEDFVRCLDAGGDDFLAKPIRQSVLSAKIRAMERIGDLQARAGAMYAQIQQDQAMAKSVFSGAVMGLNVAASALRTTLVPASTFSGDLILTAYAPSGDLYVLFGDFTGHGLAAALGALPAAEVFRAMSGKGFAPSHILSSINAKLRQLLPRSMFLAATFVHVASDLTRVSICNCGMPEAWIVEEGMVRRRIASTGLPLAVSAEQEFESVFEVVQVRIGSSVFLASDGVFEACDPAGRAFGSQRSEQALSDPGDTGKGIDRVTVALDEFRSGAPLADDVSLAEIVLVPELFPSAPNPSGAAPPPIVAAEPAEFFPAEPVREAQAEWVVSMELRGETLRRIDPVPLLISQMQEFDSMDKHCAALYTVTTELFGNALDHGLLGLSSELKTGADGFARYVEERHCRLEALHEGWIRLTAASHMRPDGARFTIVVEDSGSGFSPLSVDAPRDTAPHGRGIQIVRGLCESLDFECSGRRAVAVYFPGRKARRHA